MSNAPPPTDRVIAEPALLPCPFCGGEAALIGGDEVGCLACGLWFAMRDYSEAIAAWNRRADNATLRAVEAERDEIVQDRNYWRRKAEEWELDKRQREATIASLSADLAQAREQWQLEKREYADALQAMSENLIAQDEAAKSVIAQAQRRNEQHTAAYDELAAFCERLKAGKEFPWGWSKEQLYAWWIAAKEGREKAESALAGKEAENAELRRKLAEAYADAKQAAVNPFLCGDDDGPLDLQRKIGQAIDYRARLAAEAGKREGGECD